jgi:hypothetical protein
MVYILWTSLNFFTTSSSITPCAPWRLGSAILGIVSGALGSFAVLRKQSLLGDAISHAALPGIVIAFLLTRSREPVILMLGALIAGWLATLFMLNVVRTTRIKDDSALGTGAFGLLWLRLDAADLHPTSARCHTSRLGQVPLRSSRHLAYNATWSRWRSSVHWQSPC